MKRIRKYLIVGLVTVLPLVFLGWVGSLLYTPISNAIGVSGLVPLLLGIIVVIVGIISIGFLFSHIEILRRVKKSIEVNIINRIPLIKTVYKFSKDLVESTLAEKTYDKVVKAYPFGRGGASAIGFLTNEEASAVFVMSAPSFLTGHVYFDCEYDLIDWNYEQAIKFNVSMGMSVTKIKELLK
jgi:uncharacterized membrane protein